MNVAANMLGLDNAATPLGLKAMEQLQELNPKKDTATNPMIMFLVLNTSGLTLIPVSIMVYRAQLGAAQPTDVFVPILLATFCSTVAGIIVTSLYQRINLLNRTMLLTLGGLSLAVATIIWGFSAMDKAQMNVVSTSVANILLMLIIVVFILAGMRKKVNVYDAFIEGAKDGFSTAVRIIPYLVAILVGIGVFRASGAMDMLIGGVKWGGVAGYGTAMVLSYLVGQRKYPINYPLKSIGVYVAITALFYFLMTLSNDNLPEWAALAVNTALVLAFIGHVVYHDLPLKSLPVVGKYFK